MQKLDIKGNLSGRKIKRGNIDLNGAKGQNSLFIHKKDIEVMY